MNKKYLIIGAGATAVVIIATIGGVMFWQKNNQPPIDYSRIAGTNSQARGRTQGSRASGSILSVGADSFTVDLDNEGGQKIFTIDSTTKITEIIASTKDTILKVGNTISITTDTNNKDLAATIRTAEQMQQPTGTGTGNRPSGTPRVSQQGQDRTQNPGQNQNQFRNIGTIGQVTKIEGNTVTVKGFNNQETTITINENTKYEDTKVAKSDAIKEGRKVTLSYTGTNIVTNVTISQ